MKKPSMKGLIQAYQRKFPLPESEDADAYLVLTQLVLCGATNGGGFSYPSNATLMNNLGWRSLDRVDHALAVLVSRHAIEPCWGDDKFGGRKKGWRVMDWTESESEPAPAVQAVPPLVLDTPLRNDLARTAWASKPESWPALVEAAQGMTPSKFLENVERLSPGVHNIESAVEVLKSNARWSA